MQSRFANLGDMKQEITLAIARAAGEDAATRQMKKAGRSAWSLADRNKAAAVCHALLRTHPDYPFVK